jgi:hypothetical protein
MGMEMEMERTVPLGILVEALLVRWMLKKIWVTLPVIHIVLVDVDVDIVAARL